MNIQNIQESCMRVQNNKQEPQTEEVRVIQMGTKGRKLRVVSKHNGPWFQSLPKNMLILHSIC